LDSKDVSDFFALDTYISEEAIFPPDIWAQCSAKLNLTTNV